MTPFVDIHTHQRRGGAIELRSVESVAEVEGFCSLGIHPWRAEAVSDSEVAELLRAMMSAEIDAIGEVGMDALRGGALARQQELFEAQLHVAEQRGLPVIVHSVRSFESVMSSLGRFRLRAVIFHSWIGSAEQATRAMARGYLLSVGPRTLSSSRTMNGLRGVDIGHLLAETDDTEEQIESIYNRLAQEFGMESEQLKASLFENFRRIWQNGWSAPSCCSEARS